MLKWLMLLVFILQNLYVVAHLLHACKGKEKKIRKRTVVSVFVWLGLSMTIILGRAMDLDWLIKFGNYWLGFLIYTLFCLIVGDLVCVVLRLIRGRWLSSRETGLFLAVSLGCSLFFSVYGNIHARQIKTASYEITLPKDGGKLQDLKIALVADLHLGYNIGCRDMEKMTAAINQMEPDLVLVGGDIIDNGYDYLDDPQRLAEILSGIESRYGTYAVYGNHDVEEMLIGGFPVGDSENALRDPRLDDFIKDCGMTLLEDETVLIDDSLYLVGRLDEERNGYGTEERAELKELTKDVDPEKPLLVLNHEPDRFDEYEACDVDVLLSGHTHAGQFFPLTIVQPLAWGNHWGMKLFGDMYNFVTSGIGVYGPPMRVFTDSEIMEINIHFDESK